METRTLDKLKIAPIAVISLAIIYPGIKLLFKYLSPSYTLDSKIDCQILPGELVGSIFLAEVILMYLWIALLPKINNAIFLMLYGAFSFLSIGSVFFMVVNVVLLCPPISPEIFNQYPIYMGGVVVFSIIIFIFHLRPRTIKAIKLNKKKIDFSKMVFSIDEPLKHISSNMSIKSISILSMSAAFMGLGLARLIGDYLSDDYRLAIFLIVMALLSYLIIGYLMLIQLYTTYIIYKKTKKLGKKMTIKEFNV